MTTGTEKIRDALYYADMVRSALDFSDGESVEELVDRRETAAGAAIRVRVALIEFVRDVYDADFSLAKKGTKSAEIQERLKKINFLTFSLRKDALNMSVEELKNSIEQARIQASALPMLIAALQAGEDEMK